MCVTAKVTICISQFASHQYFLPAYRLPREQLKISFIRQFQSFSQVQHQGLHLRERHTVQLPIIPELERTES
jgi:hypothetical protein